MQPSKRGSAPIKINMVVMAGVNEDEIDDMVAFCIEHGFILRLIETMPMGCSGRNTGFVDLQPIRRRLQASSNWWKALSGRRSRAIHVSPDRKFSVGFITPMSQHFCATCNRVRLAVDGTLYLCLGHDLKVELRPLLRGGASDAELENAIRTAIELKPERHEFRKIPPRSSGSWPRREDKRLCPYLGCWRSSLNCNNLNVNQYL